MNEPFLLGIDQGTTGSTALIFNSGGQIIGRGYSEFRQIYPQPGWVEHDPEEIFSTTVKVVKEAIENAKVSPKAIAGIGITNQRETTVVWDRNTGKPIANAIVWQCRRTTERCQKLKKDGNWIRKKTGLVLDPYFSATKIDWLLNNISAARQKAERGTLLFGTIDTWLIWKLTNGKVHATDYTNASRTLLFDLEKKAWSKELCKFFRVPEKLLPSIQNSSGKFGETAAEYFGAEISILGVAGDQQSALFGHFATNPGQAKCTFGTGAFALAQLGKKPKLSKHGLLTTITCDENGKPMYGLEGSIFMAGAIVQWLRDELKIIQKASETERIARSVPDSGGVILVPAFVGMGAPYWKPEARAALTGMTRGTSRAHIVRAALEAIAYQTHDLIYSMNQDLPKKLKELRVDGGVTTNPFLMEWMADLLGIPVHRPAMLEMTAFGAARLAAITLGLWKSEKDLSFQEDIFKPQIGSKARNEYIAHWKKAVNQILT